MANEPLVKKVKTKINVETQKHFAINSVKNYTPYILLTTGDKRGDSKTSNYQKLSHVSVSKMSETYLERVQAFKKVLYVEKINGI